MANIIQCDRCGTQSPDTRGLFVANHWITLRINEPFKSGLFEKNSIKHICNECWIKVEAVLCES